MGLANSTLPMCSLDTIPFYMDPEEYTSFASQRRGSIHKLLNGGTIFQDQGAARSDRMVALKGKIIGDNPAAAAAIVTQLIDAYEAAPGTTHVFKDYNNQSFNVVFTPNKESLVIRPVHGSIISYDYEMSLSVVS